MRSPTPRADQLDIDDRRTKPFLERLEADCKDWALNGYGTPGVVFLQYGAKLVIYLVACFVVISVTTPGIAGLTDVRDWWFEPIVFQKFAAWALVWEILGLGSGSMRL